MGWYSIPNFKDQQLFAAEDDRWLVSSLPIYFGANLYSPYHKISGQNILCNLSVIYYSFLIIVNV